MGSSLFAFTRGAFTRGAFTRGAFTRGAFTRGAFTRGGPLLLFAACVALPLGAMSACSSANDAAPSGAEADGSTVTSVTSDGGAPATDAAAQGDGGLVDAAVDAGTPQERYVGRTRAGAAGVECNWSGCRAIARFSGTAASITIGERAGGSAAYDVLVDGVVQATPITPGVGADFPLATGLPPGEHTVEVWKRSEAKSGLETFQGFTFPGGGALLAPPPRGKHTVEFVGDSVTAGLGALGADPCTPTDLNTSARVSFAGVAAAALEADATFIAYSGKGVTRNNDVNDTQLLSQLYAMTAVSDGAPTWDFTANPVDAVVIALGANDFTIQGGQSPTQAAFKTGYQQLLALVRSKNPNAYVFATYTPTMYDPGISVARAAIPAAITALSDAKIFFVDTVPDSTGADVTGCWSHPNVGYHAQAGAAVAAFIKAKTGW